MSHRPNHLWPLLGLLLSLGTTGTALADDDDDRRGGRQRDHKEEFWDGPCKVEREWKKNGDFKEERKCRGGGEGQPEGKTEFRDGPCKVEREWKENGDFKEERKCDGRGRRPHARPMSAPPPAAYPPWVVVQQQGGPVYRGGHEPAPPQRPVSHCNSQSVGQVIGGIAGAVIGSQVGKGDGRAVATVGGAIAGVLIGGEIGRRIDAANQACIAHALEFAPAGQRIEWAAAGSHYAVVPGPVATRGGTHCRPYEAQVQVGGGWQKTRGTACRQPDGTWVAANG